MSKRIYIALFLLSLIIQSCIRDDLSDCMQGKYIWFESLNPNYVYKDIVNRVNLYLYDEQRQFLQELTYLPDELATSQAKVFIPDQMEGAYTIVALVNLTGSYSAYNKERLETWKLSLLGINNNQVSTKPPDIYHAIKKVSFCTNNCPEVDTLYLEKNTNHIELIVTSSDPRGLENIQTLIKASNSLSNYENLLLGDRVITYHPHHTVQATSQIQYSFTTLLLRIGGDASVCLTGQNPDGSSAEKELFNIVTKLSRVKDHNGIKLYDTNAKLAKEDKFTFEMHLDESSQIIDLEINDWYVIKNYIIIK